MDFDRAQRAPTPGAAATDHAMVPGKRTLSESLVEQRREAASAPDAELAESGTAASAPAPLPVSASSTPRPGLEMLFGVQRAATAAPVDDPAHVHAAAARSTATPASTVRSGLAIQRKTDGAAPPTTAVIVDDNVAPTELQMQRKDFIATLHRALEVTVSQVLGPEFPVADCPYITKYIAAYASKPAAEGEQFARRYTGSTAHDAKQLMLDLLARVRIGVAQWKQTGKLPADVAAADPVAAASVTAATALHKKADGSAGGGNSPAQVMQQLGEGTPLPSSVATRMGGAFGTNLDAVRIHTDAGGGAIAQQQGALAFTVGNHIAFAPGRYSPGTVEGDALFAHELTHVMQQRGATPGDGAGSGSAGAEADADRGALAVVNQLHGAGTEKAAPSLTSDFQLQRCSGNPADTGLMGTDYKGKFLGQKVGETRDEIVSMLTTTLKQPIKASRTLGAYETEAAAIAVVKTNGKPGAVTVEDGKFVAYETDLGFLWRDNYIASMSEMGGGGTQFHPPVLAPGVIALISNELVTVRAGQFDPGSKTDQQGSGDAALKAIDNPVAGYRQALGDDKGDLNGLADDKLIAAFNGALKDTAIVVLNKSSDEVKTKQARFAQGGGGVSDTEYDTMKQTAAAIAALDPQISAAQQKLDGLNLSRAMTYGPAGGGPVNTMYDKDIEAARKDLESLQTQRKIQIAKYPLLSRVDNAKFKDKSKDEMAKDLGGELPGILKDIETTKQNVADGKINLWGVDQIVDATIAGFGLNEAKRKVILDTKASEAKKKVVETVVFTVFAIGFGIAAMFATGGAALFFAAGAFGLSTYDAMKQTEQYMVDKPASNIAEDKDGGFNAPPGWGWLVVAWIGVGLDATQVVSAVGKVAKTGKVIEGAEELAKAETAAKMGMTREALLAKLRQVAGDVDGAAKITEGTRMTIAQRLGIAVDIDPKLVGDVRIYYEVDKTTGKVIVKGLSAGPEATLAEVLAHENVVKLMRRYEGVTGKLREIWEKLLALVGKSPSGANPFQDGSKAWESWNELQKMPELVEATKLKYANGVGKANESALAHDLEVLEEEARRHEKIVAEMVDEAGAGFVAKTGDSTKAAVAAKYPLPPGCKTAEEMLAKGYYYRKSADGTYEIVRKSESVGQQLRVEFDATGKIPVRLVSAVEKLEAKIPDVAQLARLRAVVTDDARLAKLYDAVLDADRLEKLLKDVGDVGKLEGLLAKVPNSVDLAKLLKSFPIADLEPILANVKKPELLAVMLDHVGADSAKSMIQRWAKKAKWDDLDTFMEKLNSGVGKELAETSGLGKQSVIIDSNTAIALEREAKGLPLNDGEKARLAYLKTLPAGTELRVGNVTVGEVGSGVIAAKGVPIEVARDSAEYQKVLAKLDALNLGGGKGAADRALVADAFFAKTEAGAKSTFLTGDKDVYNKLAGASGVDMKNLGGKTIPQMFPNGFDVTIEGRTIKVIPINE